MYNKKPKIVKKFKECIFFSFLIKLVPNVNYVEILDGQNKNRG